MCGDEVSILLDSGRNLYKVGCADPVSICSYIACIIETAAHHASISDHTICLVRISTDAIDSYKVACRILGIFDLDRAVVCLSSEFSESDLFDVVAFGHGTFFYEFIVAFAIILMNDQVGILADVLIIVSRHTELEDMEFVILCHIFLPYHVKFIELDGHVGRNIVERHILFNRGSIYGIREQNVCIAVVLGFRDSVVDRPHGILTVITVQHMAIFGCVSFRHGEQGILYNRGRNNIDRK